MLVRLLYVSKAVGPVTTTVTSTILKLSNKNNQELELTGVLCQGSGLYIQALEGPRSNVNDLFKKIMADQRNTCVEMLSLEEISHRKFEKWSMALVHLNGVDPITKVDHSRFDPYSAKAKETMDVIDELLKSGYPIVSIAD